MNRRIRCESIVLLVYIAKINKIELRLEIVLKWKETATTTTTKQTKWLMRFYSIHSIMRVLLKFNAVVTYINGMRDGKLFYKIHNITNKRIHTSLGY